MYDSVLLAYDGSREGRTALREGALLARRFGSKVFLLCVVPENPGVRIGEAAHAGAMVHTQDVHVQLFEEAMERLQAFGFERRGRLVTGEPAAEIAACAREIKADLLVVGHRKKSLLERWWSGGTGAYLVDHIGCSLLISRRLVSDAEFFAEVGPVEPAT
ncbi:universal stress protein [Phenylobacterium sp.]|uniref:universal stress protein n=1 Tax=Phenylobacterium sp. TaxID=1871053 RepID=UPI0025D81DD9|nr:universal stress protein [Phenylobacterium sp.]